MPTYFWYHLSLPYLLYVGIVYSLCILILSSHINSYGSCFFFFPYSGRYQIVLWASFYFPTFLLLGHHLSLFPFCSRFKTVSTFLFWLENIIVSILQKAGHFSYSCKYPYLLILDFFARSRFSNNILVFILCYL